MTTTVQPDIYGLGALARAEYARQSLEGFCTFFCGDDERILYETGPAEHHSLIISKLEAVERGEIKRLMLFLPPGAAKSTYASVVFPAWYLGRNRDKSIIGGSHTGDLAETFGKRARNTVDSRAFREVFGAGLSETEKGMLKWALKKPEGRETATGGDYRGVGVSGGITGHRADGIIVDDPVKGREEADSLRMRDKAWNWYVDDLCTRMKPDCWQVFIMTRWHEDDLAGRILPESYAGESGKITARDGTVWDVVCIPAQNDYTDPASDLLGRERGEYLWPGWFDPEELERIKNRPGGERSWSALYQQRPSPETGLFFQRRWLQHYQQRPRHLQIYGTSDYAVTEDDGDFTVHMILGVDSEDDLYILDLWRGQTSSLEWVESFCDLCEKWKPIGWAEEAGQIIKGVGPFLTKRMEERKIYTARFQFASSSDKSTRAQSIRGRVQQGKLYLPTSQPWVPGLVSEMMTFPAGVNDDQVDALSLIGRVLPQLMGGRVPEERKPVEQTLDQLFHEQDMAGTEEGRVRI
jgi:predicted phage terminase large subunit-like protein